MCLLPRRSHLMWCLCWPLRPLDRFPRRFPLVPLPLVLALFQPPPPPLWCWPPALTTTTMSPLCSNWRCWLCSPLCPSLPFGTSPLRRGFVYRPAGPMFPTLLPRSDDSVIAVTPVSPFAAPAMSRFAPLLSLDPLPDSLPPHLTFLGHLHPYVPPLAPPPWSPAADIAHKDKSFCDQTGGG